MQILISGKGVVLTDAIESYVNKKIGHVTKFLRTVLRADVVVGQETNRHKKGDLFFAECRLEIPGKDLFAEEHAKDLYTAIDMVEARLAAEIKKRRTASAARRRTKNQGVRANKEYSP